MFSHLTIGPEAHLRLELLIMALNFVALVGLAYIIDKTSAVRDEDESRPAIASKIAIHHK
ncbi:MAG TPA: hypothetical protein VGK74_07900 [Symbiobacteriaceae bacterium]|jgi:hypothetical protein